MRLVSFEDLKPGMIIADDFYGLNGGILAKKDTELSEKYICNLSRYEIPYLYVHDLVSEDVPVRCTITSATRNEATQNLKKFCEAIKDGRENTYEKHLEACKKSVRGLLDDIVSEKIEVYDVFDIKMIENYQYQQPVNVLIISLIMGKYVGLSYGELFDLAMAAYFHDIGNVFIPEEILSKVDKLSDSEYEIIKTHTKHGYNFAKDVLGLPMKTYLAIAQHHERYDGKGYPYGLKAKEINVYARIIAVADVFDALSSRRRQRSAHSPIQSYKMTVEGVGSHFDPEYVRAFANRVSPYPIGYTLKMKNRMGVVTMNFKEKPFNPLVKVIEEDGKPVQNPFVITLGVT